MARVLFFAMPAAAGRFARDVSTFCVNQPRHFRVRTRLSNKATIGYN